MRGGSTAQIFEDLGEVEIDTTDENIVERKINAVCLFVVMPMKKPLADLIEIIEEEALGCHMFKNDDPLLPELFKKCEVEEDEEEEEDFD